MPFTRLQDKQEIERFLRRDIYLHIYSLGDLDDFFWPYTIFFGLKTNDQLDAVALLYSGQDVPTLLALSNEGDAVAELVCSIKPELPPKFYAHLSPGLENILTDTHDLTAHGTHHKMALQDQANINKFDTSDVVPLSSPNWPRSKPSTRTATRATGSTPVCWKHSNTSASALTANWSSSAASTFTPPSTVSPPSVTLPPIRTTVGEDMARR